MLFLERNKPHRAAASQRLAQGLQIQLRWLPKACSELNVMDHLWRHAKDDGAANEPMPDGEGTVGRASRSVHALTPKQRLQKAGALAQDFWLADAIR